MPVETTRTMTSTVLNMPMRIDPLCDFRFDGLRQQPLGAVSKNAPQPVVIAHGWQGNYRIAPLSHGGVLRRECGSKQTKFKPKYAAFFNSTHPQHSGIAPFVVRLADGRSLRVPHPDFLAIGKRRLVLIDEKDGWSFIEPLLIVSIDQMKKTPPGGNGKKRW